MLTYSNISLRSKNELLAAILFVDSLYGNLLTVSFFIVYIFITNSGRNYDQKVYFNTKLKRNLLKKYPQDSPWKK